ncbi:hypothetical protein B1A99_35085 [Cohnella sp. CIP 111063]|uniref:hypothetical protein n=1 Tax=unclassified Cohnella TaxID=2636738 RepID=UPI000B8BE27B|nr:MULTISPECIES: hypothetical protein [unclassified Cohnella]OXS52043.1 hypothetical protein B1A99_35085 [Cohnella sp. CIP 111063]PRX51990.1 hypothetical protein B0G52_1591 [Cohnella sp. SGD-V74]
MTLTLLEKDPKYLLSFEKSRLSTTQREFIFKKIFEKNTARGIWLSVDSEDLANLVRTREIFDYLLEYVAGKGDFVARYNAIQVVQHYKEFANNDLIQILLEYAIDQSENINVRVISIQALARLDVATKGILDQLSEVTKDKNNIRIQMAFFQLIGQYNELDDYIDLLIEAIPLVRFRQNHDNYYISTDSILEVLEKVKQPKSVLKIVNFFVEDTNDLIDIYIKDYTPHLVIQAVSANNSEIYDAMRTLLVKCVTMHYKEPALQLKHFFIRTDVNSILNTYYNSLYKLNARLAKLGTTS